MPPPNSSASQSLSTEAEELLALLLEEQQLGAGTPTAIPRRGGPGPWPLSFPQQRLWFLDRYGVRGAAYHMPLNLRLTGAPRLPALVESLREIVRRHEALRTAIVERDGAPVLICPHPVATARSAMVVSSVSPDRCDMTAV